MKLIRSVSAESGTHLAIYTGMIYLYIRLALTSVKLAVGLLSAQARFDWWVFRWQDAMDAAEDDRPDCPECGDLMRPCVTTCPPLYVAKRAHGFKCGCCGEYLPYL